MQPLSSYTLADPKVMQNPYPYYERLRAEDPVHFDQGIPCGFGHGPPKDPHAFPKCGIVGAAPNLAEYPLGTQV